MKKGPIAVAMGPAVTVHGVLQSLAGLESGQLGSFNGDLGAGLRVAALARRTLTNFKRTEAHQRDLLAVLQGGGDGAQRGVDSLFGILLGQIRFGCDSRDQFNFRHRFVPPK